MAKTLIVRDRWPIGRLRPNPLQKDIYSNREATGEFVERVRKYGIQTDIKVVPNGKILGGHRRYYAAQIIGLSEVPVVIRHDLATDPIGQDEVFYLDNDVEPETTEERTRRFQGLLKCEERRAAKRKKRGLKKGGSPVTSNLTEREKPEEKGESAEKAAQSVGMSKNTARKASEVVNQIDSATKKGDTETAEDLRKTLNKSVDGAHKKIQPEPQNIHDSNGNPVPAKFLEHHDAVSKFRSVCSHLDKARKLASELNGVGSEHFHAQTAAEAIKKVREDIMDKSYWSHCPCGSKCDRCSQTGYLPRGMRSKLNTDEKKSLNIE